MREKIIVFSLLLVSLLIRIVPIIGDQFYFTIDQGRDAVMARSILNGSYPLIGPVTDIDGLHHGVIWFYLVAVSLFASGGHPIGPILLLIIFNIFIIGVIFIYLKRTTGSSIAIISSATLSVFWPFYDLSRYAFNPFLSTGLFIMLLILLERSIQVPKTIVFAAITVGLVFHSEIAIFPIALTIYLLHLKLSNAKFFFIGLATIGVFLIPHLVFEITSDWSQTTATINHLQGSQSVLKTDHLQNFLTTGKRLIVQIGEAVLPLFPMLGFAAYIITLASAMIKKRVPKFTTLTTLTTVLTLIWFTTNSGWRPWQTVFIPTLVLVSFTVMLHSLIRNGLVYIFLLLLLINAANLFIKNGQANKNSHDSSLLHNQLKVIDQVYSFTANNDFSTYTYVPSVRDYQYQYLIHWHGIRKYGYLPCEYTTFPQISAISYIPDAGKYQNTKPNCKGEEFLIIEPEPKNTLLEIWESGIANNRSIAKQVTIGDTIIKQLAKE